jgi:wobble nucleotide-excising tRNase
MTIRHIASTDIEQALVSPDPKIEAWVEVVEAFTGAGWATTVECPFCERNTLSVLDARAGARADLRRWIFCRQCGERISMPAICSN